jgi:hypothetical protein
VRGWHGRLYQMFAPYVTQAFSELHTVLLFVLRYAGRL